MTSCSQVLSHQNLYDCTAKLIFMVLVPGVLASLNNVLLTCQVCVCVCEREREREREGERERGRIGETKEVGIVLVIAGLSSAFQIPMCFRGGVRHRIQPAPTSRLIATPLPQR